MPILDFPPSPSVGQLYENDSSGTYRWNGYAWDRVNAYVVPIGIPDGGIIMWSGSITNIPPSFALCDGTNGTPNLIDRFIVGAGSTYAVGATGGSANAVAVSHSHSASFSGSTSSAGNHNHTYQCGGGGGSGPAINSTSNVTSLPTNYAGDHTHSVSGTVTITGSGEDGTNKNLPPFFALAFIMKVAA